MNHDPRDDDFVLALEQVPLRDPDLRAKYSGLTMLEVVAVLELRRGRDIAALEEGGWYRDIMDNTSSLPPIAGWEEFL